MSNPTPYGQPYAPTPSRGRGRGGGSAPSSRPSSTTPSLTHSYDPALLARLKTTVVDGKLIYLNELKDNYASPSTPSTSASTSTFTPYRSTTTFPTAASTFISAYPTSSSPYPTNTPAYQAAASSFPTAASTFPSTPTNYGSYSSSSNFRQSSYSAYPSSSYSTAGYTPGSYSGASGSAAGLVGLSGAPIIPAGAPASMRPPLPMGGLDEDGEGDDELLPAMADDDYSAQLSWQSESKDNLKVLMDSFTPEQYERFEAYRRHALPKQAVRKVIQQTVGMQVSPPVAQIVAGFAKVFVGEMVEKARAVQERRGETGPLTPDHLREAYRLYQQETGAVGAARPLKRKKLFVR
ncbi:TAFII28 domain-containing protein [Mycena chlorophos]|uniref:Transcription initiation factor TFIID subunit 11 n=1 Tax=Mycena chlorophos TaxID=658473 RepID=A0A8H6SFF6_MYCCL|nr:TAFII28 domain-containing protein [Mycena chlorophos]